MAFQGSLKTITIPELFSLLHQLRRTGILTVVSERDETSFLFYRGNLIYATARDGSRRMGSYLVRLGLLTVEDLDSALAAHTNGDIYFGQRLVEMGRLQRGDIHQAIEAQILDILGEVLAWSSGAFHFDDNDLPFAIPDGSPVSTHSVILEATRRSDERSYVRSLFPDLSLVLQADEPQPGEPPAVEQAKILELADGQRTVEQILFASPISEQATATALEDLVSKGFLRQAALQGSGITERAVPELHCLPVAPNVPGRLFSVFNGDGYQLQRISRILAEDPMLAAKALKSLTLANAEIPRPKLGIAQLAEVLGTFQLRSLLLPEAIRGLFFSRPEVFWKECWEHSLLSAQLSQRIAELAQYPFPEEAYLAGLLHNLGAFVLMSRDPERYRQVVRESIAREEDVETLEESAFGISHSRVGGVLAEKWLFPRALVLVIKGHHKVDANATSPVLNIVSAANGLTEESGIRIGYAPDSVRQYRSSLKRLNLHHKKVLSLVRRVPRAIVPVFP